MDRGGAQKDPVFDIAIIGAGPVGLACGLEAHRCGLSHVILEKGCLTNSLFHFPKHMTFFSTPELLEIGGIPFVISTEKPTRPEALNYYRRVTAHFELNVRLYERVINVISRPSSFEVITAHRSYGAKFVVIATGFYDHPNLLDVPGETLPKVSHYYTEPFSFYRRRVAVIGGKNSAVEAALDLYRHGAEVTLIHRGPEIRQSVKYWILPDILNRIQEGSIRALFNAQVAAISPEKIFVQPQGGMNLAIDNDHVFALTGYHPDYDFLEQAGIAIEDQTRRPHYHAETFETNVTGIYVAGVVAAGKEGNSIFIENGRMHAKSIIKDIERRMQGSNGRESVPVMKGAITA
ncbi:MAG: YpdA family putative bacillithiol disulfide reductase [bacterium]